MSWFVRRLEEIPLVPGGDEDEPDWRPLQYFFRLTAFGANVFTARGVGETLVEAHDERESGQEELYVVLDGEAEFEVGGEAFVAARGTVVALPDPAVSRRATAHTLGASLLVIGTRPGCFETTWRAAHFADVPRASGPT